MLLSAEIPAIVSGQIPVEISPWKPAPFALGGETVFAVGDIHGCLEEMTALLGTIATLAAETSAPRRLIYLGDMIDRGPSTIGVLKQWAEPPPGAASNVSTG